MSSSTRRSPRASPPSRICRRGSTLGEYGDQITDYTGNIGDAFGEIADSNVDLYNYDLLKWLPDNYEWLEEADAQGLLEDCKGDLMRMTQMAQYECFTQDMYNHQEDIAKYAALEGLKEAGVYALADEVYDDVFDGITITLDDNNMDIEDFASEAANRDSRCHGTFPSTKPSTPMMRLWRTASFTGNT